MYKAPSFSHVFSLYLFEYISNLSEYAVAQNACVVPTMNRCRGVPAMPCHSLGRHQSGTTKTTSEKQSNCEKKIL
jgi:hypothetical protein